MNKVITLKRRVSGAYGSKSFAPVPATAYEVRWYIENSLDWVCDKVVKHLGLDEKFQDDDVLELTISRIRYTPKSCTKDLL